MFDHILIDGDDELLIPQVYNKTQFFVENDIYWAPASTMSDLYSQLASKKYREICGGQIKYVHTSYNISLVTMTIFKMNKGLL